MNKLSWSRLVAASLAVVGALASTQALAQVPGRFYWHGLVGANGVPLIFNSLTGNSNPFDPSHQVTPGELRCHHGHDGLREDVRPGRSLGHGRDHPAHGTDLG